MGAGSSDCVEVVQTQPGDGDDRQRAVLGDLRQARDAELRVRHALGGGGEDRPEPDVVRAVGRRLLNLSQRSGGGANQRARAQQRTGLRDRQIVLAQVDAVRTGQERQIDPIVDQHPRPGRAGHLDDRTTHGERRAIRVGLEPQLQHPCPALDHVPRRPNQIEARAE